MTKVNALIGAAFQSVACSRRAGPEQQAKVMKVQLLVSETCVPCGQAEKVWRQVADERALDFSVVNLTDPQGRQLADDLQLKTIPAVVIDGVLVAIGVQSLDEARALIAQK